MDEMQIGDQFLVTWLRSDIIPAALKDGCNKAAFRLSYLLSVIKRREDDPPEQCAQRYKKAMTEAQKSEARIATLFVHCAEMLRETMERHNYMGDEETEMIQWWHNEYKRKGGDK